MDMDITSACTDRMSKSQIQSSSHMGMQNNLEHVEKIFILLA